jgi:hypothetical protein
MSEIERLAERVERARRTYATLPVAGWGEPGPLDPQTGERWDRGHVLGHVAEMLPYWAEQVRAVLEGGEGIGRDRAGALRRRQAIEGSREASPTDLLADVDAGLESLLSLLDAMSDEDLGRPLVVTHVSTGTRQLVLRDAVEEMLVGHAEAHLLQLAELG